MQYKEALKLKEGDKVTQKANGYIITVEHIETYRSMRNFAEYVTIVGTTENGCRMRHNHKEVNKYKGTL